MMQRSAMRGSEGGTVVSFRKYEDLARALGRDETQIREAIDRDRHRRPEVWHAKRRHPRRKKPSSLPELFPRSRLRPTFSDIHCLLLLTRRNK